MKIIREPSIETGVSYSLEFDYRGSRGHGFTFACDEEGNVDVDALPDAARANFGRCLCGEVDVVFRGVRRREWTYREPRVGLCDCGEEVYLDRFTNTCYGCGTDYNSAGQELAPREQWGCETGEHWSECY
jgi:hypothetical protein